MLGLFGYSSRFQSFMCEGRETRDLDSGLARELPSREAHSPQKSRETRVRSQLGRDFANSQEQKSSKETETHATWTRDLLASCQVAKANVAAETRDSRDLESRLGRDLLSRKDQFPAIPEAHAT
ncbi:hypothetical protein ACOSQ3_018469 [Xanthoceras sorbifolium]